MQKTNLNKTVRFLIRKWKKQGIKKASIAKLEKLTKEKNYENPLYH